jgi:hypothetical protein
MTMPRFTRHYTLEEARALLPRIRQWFARLDLLAEQLRSAERTVDSITATGADAGGSTVNQRLRLMADIKAVVLEFEQREIQLKDLDRGLVDFPSLRDGREVFLCWEKSEDDIEHWHDLDTGYSNRQGI